MAKGVKARKPAAKPDSRLPSKDDLLAFIAANPGEAGKREIARAFHLKGGDKIGLKRLLKELEEDGSVDRRGKRLHQPGTLPNVVLTDVTGRDADGELLAKPVEWDEDHGPAPVILIVTGRRGKERAPGVGDRALLRVEKSTEPGPDYNGRVIKIISKTAARVLGIYRALQGGGGRLEPVDKKKLGSFLDIAAGEEGEARDGDLVAVDVLREGRFGRPKARVRERLGSMTSEKAVSLIAIETHGIPNAFPPSVLAEADAAKPATMKGREDWRKLPLVTIDPPDAKDHDDAVHAEADSDTANDGGFVVTVAIADVAAYVTPGSVLDEEALKRGNSVYFPDRVVPMLPERISNDLCSLRPGVDRPALAVRLVIGKDGRKKSHSFHRIMMRSAAKLAYAQAQNAIDGVTDETTDILLEPVLKPLWAAYACVSKAREARQPLDLDLPERKIILNADGGVDRVIVPPRLEAHRLIEEFMILANVAAAEELTQKKTPLVFRVHDQPSLEKLNGLREVLSSLGIDLPKQENLRPANFNRILERVAGTENAPLVNEVVLRSQAQAEYSADNYGHFGLNLRRYAHFTSPIRRYADLIVHRALIRALGLGKDGLPDAMTVPVLNEIGAQISAAERRAMAAERETVDRLIAHYLADRVGSTFTGRITGVTRSGLFVSLAETGASGFVPAATIGKDYYAHDEARQALIGAATGESFRLGDTAEVRLVEAAPVAGALRFELLSEGRYLKPSGDSRRGKRRERGTAKASSAKSRVRRSKK
ncbi:ribonuclease R [Agaricicola taiwanensis]|uniref:Ribonuclease R n=1 Tax=Agaricicola taiwanensis TaxID=591372 RepID=A0A8J2YJ69_9RHOB|nr:ribonuclease R [Agaricicola taiwanensis]GGE47221.1 ribonuclease R [Agaricicola taiwanensis]